VAAQVASVYGRSRGMTLRPPIVIATLDSRTEPGPSVLASTETLTRLSSTVQRQAVSQFEQIKALEFNEENVHAFIAGLIQSHPDMQMQMCEEVFDTIGRYHSENVAYYRGWKSNSRHRTAGMRIKSTRFILPGFAMDGWRSSPGS
jgi:hypothetical protein